MKTKYGIIGCGSISRFHFNALEKIGADVVCVADVDIERARKAAARFGAEAVTDYRKVIGSEDVTVVSILSPAKLHREMCLGALASGKNVICEKTLANNPSEALEIAAAVKSSDAVFFTAFMKRFFPAVRKAKELIPRLGTLFSAHVRSYQRWGNLYDADDASDYQWVLDGYGGGILKCGGSHTIDLTCFLCGRPSGVYGSVDYIPGSKLDRKATAMFEYEGSLTVSFEAAVHSLDAVGYERNSWDEHVEILGSEGKIDLYTVQWDAPENNGALLVHYDNKTRTSTEHRFAPVNPFDLEMDCFDKCLRENKQGHPTVIDGYNVDEIIDAVTRSSAEQRRIEVRPAG